MWHYNYRYQTYIYHYGVKGMKWGVRRTPEQLGHNSKNGVAKSTKRSIMSNEHLSSKKGFTMNGSKIVDFLLKQGAKHSKEFFDVGYTAKDSLRLFKDIEKGYDLSKATNFININNGKRFSIFMQLGMTKKKRFRTVWQIDTPDLCPRFITSYRERED